MQETRVRSLDWGDSSGEGNGYPLQYSGLENSMYSPWSHKSDMTERLSLSLSNALWGASLVVVKNPPANAGETQVPSLIREDPTCCRATKPMHFSFWTCALGPGSHNYWVSVLQLLKPACPRVCASQEKPLQWEAHALHLENSCCLLQLEKSPCNNEDPAQPKINREINTVWVYEKMHRILHAAGTPWME